MKKSPAAFERAQKALHKEFILTDDEAKKMVIIVTAVYGIINGSEKVGNETP